MMNLKTVAALMFAVGLAVTAVFLNLPRSPRQIRLQSDLTIGSRFPSIAGIGIDAEPISLDEFEGKVLLLNFFGDW